MGSLITASLDGNAVTYSTHMSYGSVFAYGLSLLFGTFLFPDSSSEIVSLNVCFVLLGLLGGILPDVDRWEHVGFSHRRTLHYAVGYGLLTIFLTTLGYIVPHNLLAWIVGASCFFGGAWLHSSMDILDGFWADDPNKGVYEHFTKRWIRALNWIPFASLREWSSQSFSAVLVIAVSPQLMMLGIVPGWILALASFFLVWMFSTGYEFYTSVPKRWEMEDRVYRRLGLEPKYRRPLKY